MAQQTWENLLNGGVPWQTQNGPTLATSTTLTTISPQAPGPQDFVLPGQPNGLQFYEGMSIKITARGTCQAAGTTSALTLSLALGASGATTAATAIATSGALTLGTTITSATYWWLEALMRCFAIGSTGTTISCGGDWHIATVAGQDAGTLGTASETFMALPETTTAYNTYTAATCLTLRGSLSAAFGSVTCNHFLLEQLC
jgi:hypothetical protein